MTKENLILIHSFPTNSIILSGLKDVLVDYFNVYMIDLPGFSKVSPAERGKISMPFFARYLEDKIKELDLPHYILGGISFGFLVINEAHISPKNCKAILAIEPYLGQSYLHFSAWSKWIGKIIIQFILSSGLTRAVWNNNLGRGLLINRMKFPYNVVDTIFDQIDRVVFFRTTKMLLCYDYQKEFSDIPYVLLINSEDNFILAKQTEREFRNHARKLLIQYNNIDHFPTDLSKKYFSDQLKPQQFSEILAWINVTR